MKTVKSNTPQMYTEQAFPAKWHYFTAISARPHIYVWYYVVHTMSQYGSVKPQSHVN